MECCYFLSDARRVLKSYEIYAAILGVAVSLYFSLENRGLVNGNVLYTYVYATEMSGMMIAYVFCALSHLRSCNGIGEHGVCISLPNTGTVGKSGGR